MKPEDLYYIDGDVPQMEQADAPPPEPWGETRAVGKRVTRVDGYERTSGTAVFPSDVTLPDMLHAATLRCPHAHAIVRRIDTSEAEKMPGVRAVLKDGMPGTDIRWYASANFASRLFDPHCRFEGEEVAVVAAETPYQAWDAVRAIKVDYEVLPFCCTEEDAAMAGAPKVHEAGNQVRDTQVYQRGDVEAGFTASDAVVEGTFTTANEIHLPMELHGCVAKWDGNRLTIWESSQGVYAIQSAVAQALQLPLANVRVIGHYMGGGFGSKLGPGKYTLMAALLARQTARPVKLQMTREETCVAIGNRPASKMTIKVGAKKDGTLTAIHFTCTASAGAYPGSGSSGVDFVVRDLYLCPNVRTESTDLYINAGPARAFRAPGHPQGAWALEQALDMLADRLRIDPVDLRIRNVPLVSQSRKDMPYTSTGLEDCLAEGAKAFGWKEARAGARATGAVRRGVGMAAGMWQGGGGSPPATIIVKLFADGSANLNMGAADLGTGTKTVMALVVAEELGLPLDRIQIEHADTGTTQFATPSGGSKTVPTESPATREAALAVKRQLAASRGRSVEGGRE
jgi:CO/xanthine dehydrogenase Mo-binding subunit